MKAFKPLQVLHEYGIHIRAFDLNARLYLIIVIITSVTWNFGWAFSSTISGWSQVRYGFGPPFIGTITLYTISVFMHWTFFRRGKIEPLTAPTD